MGASLLQNSFNFGLSHSRTWISLGVEVLISNVLQPQQVFSQNSPGAFHHWLHMHWSNRKCVFFQSFILTLSSLPICVSVYKCVSVNVTPSVKRFDRTKWLEKSSTQPRKFNPCSVEVGMKCSVHFWLQTNIQADQLPHPSWRKSFSKDDPRMYHRGGDVKLNFSASTFQQVALKG